MEKRTVCLLITLLFVLNQRSIAQQKSLKQMTFSDSTRHGFPNWSPCGKSNFLSVHGGKDLEIFLRGAQHA